MKKLLGLAIILLLSTLSYGQWLQQSSGTTNVLNEVYFLNQDTGFAVGINTILKTENGGLNWQTSYTITGVLEGIYFTNSTHGFAVGFDLNTNKATVIKTTDGGINWTNNNLNYTSIMRDIYFVNSSTGFIVGEYGSAYRTIDGGNTWDTLNTGTTMYLQSVFFTDSQNGIIVGGTINIPLILKTSDGGNNWNEISSPATSFLHGVFFPSALIGYAVGWSGEILKTIDGGDNWTVQTAAISGNLDVFFVDNNIGYIVGGTPTATTHAAIQKTTDGGQTWNEQLININNGLIGVYFPNQTTGYCVGSGGTILKTTNGGETAINDIQKSNLSVTTYPNPFVDELTIKTNNIVKMNISIYNVNGKIVYYSDIMMNNEKINLTELNSGIYFLIIETNNDKLIKRIIKN